MTHHEVANFGQFQQDGFQILTGLFSSRDCNSLAGELSALLDFQQNSARKRMGGVRNLLRASQKVAGAASSQVLASVLGQLAGRKPFPVRAILFDKNPESNWLVPWHQDLSIAVAERIETPGFCGWSLKDGVVHAQAPTEILEDMITVRLHLDDCGPDNGALRVLPGSHRSGKLEPEDVSEWTKRSTPVVCSIPRGGVLVMRPLVLHASSPAKCPAHRRVLHMEYGTQDLPNGLRWFDSL